MSWLIIRADARQIPLGDSIVDAIVTDPPYGLEFMGQEWDKLWATRDKSQDLTGKKSSPFLAAAVNKYVAGAQAQEWHHSWALEAYRVLKPGAYLLAFGGTRTFHRLTCAIEDAGFEIRDCMMWLYGSGFPKSLDVSKAIDKAAGAERKVIGNKVTGNAKQRSNASGEFGSWANMNTSGQQIVPITTPATPAAREWQGWGTALKPAWEPIIIARKPLDGTVAENVQKWGTGAMNIDAGRIASDRQDTRHGGGIPGKGSSYELAPDAKGYDLPSGRWPANVILDEESARLLDEMSGESKSTGGVNAGKLGVRIYGKFSGETIGANAGGLGDSGGASRFFYTAKADKKDRGEGNDHPTVKPQAIIEYLLKLVSRPGALILDQFVGSGTTVLVADKMGRRAIGLDNDEKSPGKARRRVFNDAPLLAL